LSLQTVGIFDELCEANYVRLLVNMLRLLRLLHTFDTITRKDISLWELS